MIIAVGHWYLFLLLIAIIVGLAFLLSRLLRH
jgi:hypothetical protein